MRETGSDKLINEIGRTLAYLDKRARDILYVIFFKRRMGFGVSPETCQTIGVSYGFTRERTYQIEAESLGEIIKEAAFWNDLFVPKLEALILGNVSAPCP
jgi:DNA-directed RNA polymerase sigma subunit (sigma70/sigma32)